MEYSPPPLFKQGAPARVKVTVFACISIALLMLDARLQVLAAVRTGAGTVLYPFQMAALMPRDAIALGGSYFSSLAALQKEVRDLKGAEVASAQAVQQARLLLAENAHLRKLMEARENIPVKSIMSEILYDARDPSTRRVVLDRGSREGVELGLPVIDNAGVVGQVTRVFPFTSEVTLLTDREQAIPVQVLRNGLRSVAYGRGRSGYLDLRFVAPDADIKVGDVLVTSGMDGIYPAGLAVAKVVQVESSANGAFGRVLCQPLAGIDRNRQLLVLLAQTQPRPPRPPDEVVKQVRRSALKPMAPLKPGAAPIMPAAPAGAAANPAPGIRPAAQPAAAAAAGARLNPVPAAGTRVNPAVPPAVKAVPAPPAAPPAAAKPKEGA
ncbi:MAG: rod shape-determining protein MreC [Pseudomonadota bacterium]